MNIEQLPVTVEEAKAMADRYKKDIIVILAYNVDFDILTMTSYGTPAQQNKAVQWGERCSEFLGGDLRSAVWHEDCRPSDTSLADIQAKLEFLTTKMQQFEQCQTAVPLSMVQVSELARRALVDLRTIKRNETPILPRVS